MEELTETLVFQWKPEEFEVSFATACAITSLTVFSSWNSLDTLAFSSDNVLNDTYAHSIVAQDDNHVISQPSCYRGCEPPADMISMEDEQFLRFVCCSQPAHEPLAEADATTLKEWIAVCGVGEDHGGLAQVCTM